MGAFILRNKHRFMFTRVMGKKSLLEVALSDVYQTSYDSVMEWPMDNNSYFVFDVFDHHKDIIKQLRHEFGHSMDFRHPQCFNLELVLIHRCTFGVLDEVREEWVNKGRELPSSEFQERVRLAFQRYVWHLRPSRNYVCLLHQAIVREGVTKHLV